MKRVLNSFIVFLLSLIIQNYTNIKAETFDQLVTYTEANFQYNNNPEYKLNIAPETIKYLQKITAKYAIQNGADIQNSKNSINQTVLHLAAKSGNVRLIKLILKKEFNLQHSILQHSILLHSILLHYQDLNKQTALDIAIEEKNENAINFLVKKMKKCNCSFCQQYLLKILRN